MWLWLLVQFTHPFASNPPSLAWFATSAQAMETSNGSTSPSEGKILWEDGKKAFEEGRYQDAVNHLQRLVDRYPGYPGYLEAHRMLGRSLMGLGRYEEAVKPLKAYIADTGDRKLGLESRLWLGEDYLELTRFSDAYLTSVEVQKASSESSRHSDPELYARSQFLKARALMGLKQDTRASRVLDAVALKPIVQSDSGLKGNLAQIRIQLKLRSCEKLPSAGPMDEEQARDQYNRRALCLQEALNLFKSAAESNEFPVAEKASAEIAAGYDSYVKATKNPPAPTKLKPTPRTAVQKERYRAELINRLDIDSKKTLHDAIDTLARWKSSAKPKAAELYDGLSKKIETLL